MNRVRRSPQSVLSDFFISKGLIFKPDPWLRGSDEFITGEVYDSHDIQIKKTKRFLFVKLGADKEQLNKVCSVQIKKIYGHRKKIAFVVFGRANIRRVEDFANELKKILKQDLLIELRCEEKLYSDSGQYASDEVIASRYSAAAFVAMSLVSICAVAVGLKFFLENVQIPEFDSHSIAMTWPKLAMIYWVLRLLLLFF